MSEIKLGAFEQLFAVNVNDKTEVKDNGRVKLTYLSWAWAWAEVKKRFPTANYTIVKNDKGLPYFYDEQAGIMCYTTMTIEGVTHEMWLPVMDGANNAMKFVPYSFKTKFGEKTVAAATMFDVNKTIMRCLVKNIGMFGLGLYIYAGEDLPEDMGKEEKPKAEKPKVEPLPFSELTFYCEECGQIIPDLNTSSGKIISAETVARKSKEKYGKSLCADCAGLRKQ